MKKIKIIGDTHLAFGHTHKLTKRQSRKLRRRSLKAGKILDFCPFGDCIDTFKEGKK